ncbi:MAG TPA: VOC family protein [Alphaproteobacteria bacterium]|jgi:predicted metalloenzyme YecM|nr:VOC family protein [Alphaproteobacteria bacterium]
MVDLNLQIEFEKYIKLLQEYFQERNIENFLESPIDHIAIKTKNSLDYQHFVNTFLTEAQNAQYIEMNDRRIATLKLIKPLKFKNQKIWYLEIMEPKPGKEPENNFFEHIEILRGNFESIEQSLKSKSIPYKSGGNEYHKTIVLNLNNLQEIKFTNTKIEEVIRKEKEDGKIKKLK